LASRFGCQCITVSIEAKKTPHGWEAYTDNGRSRTGKDAVAWAFEAVDRGAGELLLTSIDMEGTRRGFDLDLINAIGPNVPVPVIASGGCGSPEHVRQAVEAGADAVAVAHCLHYRQYSVAELRPVPAPSSGDACEHSARRHSAR
jgi:cyclase